MTYKYLIYAACLLMLLPSCKEENYTIVKVVEKGAAKVTDDELVEYLHTNLNASFQIKYANSEDSVLQLLKDKQIDFAVVSNNTGSKNELKSVFRTVSPLLPRYLFILSRDSFNVFENQDSFFKNKVLGIEKMSHSDERFLAQVGDYFGFSMDSFESVVEVDKEDKSTFKDVDFFLTISHVNNSIIEHALLNDSVSLLPLGDAERFNKGSTVEGFAFRYPQAYPFIIPIGLMSGNPRKPTVTLGIQDVLICHQDMDTDLTYELNKLITENQSDLAHLNPIYGLLHRFPKEMLFAYPFHEGAYDYMHRNEPSFFERYAELAGVVFSIIVVLGGAFVTRLSRLRSQNKEKIDVYLEEVDVIYCYKHLSNKDKIERVKSLRTKAIQASTDEEFKTTQGFQIFIDLCAHYIHELTTHKDE